MLSVNDIVLHLLYRPPGVGRIHLRDCHISGSGQKNSIIGDFNIPDIVWEGGLQVEGQPTY
jgi:hypothetical protein